MSRLNIKREDFQVGKMVRMVKGEGLSLGKTYIISEVDTMRYYDGDLDIQVEGSDRYFLASYFEPVKDEPTYKHPHHDVIIAYLNGADIEVKGKGCRPWLDIGRIKDRITTPSFHAELDYRIKGVNPNKEEIALIEDEMNKLSERLATLKGNM